MNRNPKIRIITALLGICMLITLFPISVSADPLPTHKPDFNDVPENAWYYDAVLHLYYEGVVKGYPDGGFHPGGSITCAEFTALLIRTINPPAPETPAGIFSDHWSAELMEKAYHNGIITDEDIAAGFAPNVPITRAQMTKMMILAMKIPLADIPNPFEDLKEPDPYASTAYKVHLLRGYPGENGGRIYGGDSKLTRAEAVAIIVRIMEYNTNPYDYRSSVILDESKRHPLNSELELIDLFHVLNREFITEYTFETTIDYGEWAEIYRKANVLHIEHFYATSLSCTYVPSENRYTLTLEYGGELEKRKNYAEMAEKKAQEILDEIINEEMTWLDKIGVIHDYLVRHCRYDYEDYVAHTVPFEARLAYGALIEGKAVCQGYTAAFNLLCNMAGLHSIVVGGKAPITGEVHSWNAILIDGLVYFIDPTHDDPVPDVENGSSHKFYLLTEDEMTELGYVWDKSTTDRKYFFG